MSALVAAGALSLAAGAVAGWPLAMVSQGDGGRGRLRLREPKRLLQVHLDWIMMGTLLLALAAAVPDLPAWTAALVVVGAVLNPLLFVPLAVVGAEVRRHPLYRVVGVVSFTAMSVGLVATAAHAL